MNPRSHSVAERLAAGPPRGLGAANAIAKEAQRSPQVLRELAASLRDKRDVVTIRAANALRKVQKAQPDLLAPFARIVLLAANESSDLRTRWNLTIVVGGLPLRGQDKALAVELLFEALGSGSGFLRTFALTGLVNLALEDKALRSRIRPILREAMEDSSAAMRARARKLIKLPGFEI